MIESIEFSNFKALRQTTLPLAPFTLLLGPNGSGKSTVLQALQGIGTASARFAGIHRQPAAQLLMNWSSLLSVSAEDRNSAVKVQLSLRLDNQRLGAKFDWAKDSQWPICKVRDENSGDVSQHRSKQAFEWLGRMRTFALQATAIAQPTAVTSEPLEPDGAGLVAVLDDLKDNHPDRWEWLLAEMRQWLPEYDYIQFDKPQPGSKSILLRTRKGGHLIPAHELSQGTLVALALLTLAYLPNPPTVIGLEEIDRGLHPRLLRHLQDALYRLSYPESCGEKRPPIQVIATTHSPYLLDLYRDHPEEVVLAQKEGLEVTMKRLGEIEHFEDIVGSSSLSEVWYSGVLGGVSVKP